MADQDRPFTDSVMNSSDSLLSKNLIYSSARMFERRRRILEETHQLLVECGYDGFSIRLLCQRAQVAPQTVYKAFESKERLVALSIRHYYQSFADKQHYNHATSTLAGIIERLIVNDLNMHNVRQYVSALVSIYFSQTADSDLRVAASFTAITSLHPWVIALRQGGYIRRGLSSENVIETITSALFCVTLDWCSGRISNGDFIFRKLEVFLVCAYGATRGEANKEINGYLTDLLGRRELFAKIERQALGERSPSLGDEP